MIRQFWEFISIGRVASNIHDDALALVFVFCMIATAIHFFIGCFANYQKEIDYYNSAFKRQNNPNSTIFGSMYVIFYLPFLLLGASFETLLLAQLSFNSIVFGVTAFLFLIAKIIVVVGHANDEDAAYSALGIMKTMQKIGILMTKNHKYFFEGTIFKVKAKYLIIQQQNKQLKFDGSISR